MNTQKGIAPIAVLIIALLVIGGGTAAVKSNNKKKTARENEAALNATSTSATSTSTIPSSIQVKLSEQNNSGQSGTAILTETNGKTKVIVNFTGKPSGVAQPAHIHLSSCATIGAVKYPLTNVDKGASQTELNVTMAELLAGLPLSINVHKSAAEASVYVACGDIVTERATSTAATAGDEVVTITYDTNGYKPKDVTINKGQTIRFVNESGKDFWPASANHPDHLIYPEFDPKKRIPTGQSWEFTFDKTGKWNFHDHLTNNRFGSITVK